MEWLRRRLRAWLGITGDTESTSYLIAGLRMDHDALVTAFHDARQAQGTINQRIAETLNRTTIGAAGVDRRLAYYERAIPSLAKGRKAFDAAVLKEARKQVRDAEKAKLALVTDGEPRESSEPPEAQREAAAEIADA